MTRSVFESQVALKYQLYNSLFLTLPIDEINNTGILIPILARKCAIGMLQGQNPKEILDSFFADRSQFKTEQEELDFLFKVIQYVERQVVLLDALEDAAYNDIHEVDGPGSFQPFAENHANDGNMDKLQVALAENAIRIVLTAHPTQFYPGNVLAIITDLTQAIKANDLDNIRLLLLQLGKTPFFRKEKPTPFDEAVNLSWYLENIFYQAGGKLYRKIQETSGLNNMNPSLLQFGFWPGGDRDGNPFVNVKTTLKVAKRLHDIVLRCYHRDVRKLRRRLSFRGVYDQVQLLEEQLVLAMNEPDKDHITPQGILEQLAAIKKQLNDDHGGLFANLVLDLENRVKLFGFHFATIDVRQDSRVIARTFDEIVAQQPNLLPKNWKELDQAQQLDLLFNIKGEAQASHFDDPIVRDTIASFQVIKRIQQQNGELGAHRYIISNCRGPIDMARVYALAKLGGWPDALNIDIIPLFETIDDLHAAQHSMHTMYHHPVYRAHLKQRLERQTIMLGFSDGTKDGGYFAANWNIFKAKEQLTKLSNREGLKVIFFDGRGGPPARGGGNSQRFYTSLGAEIDNSNIQLTIQGQTISSLYGTTESAMHNMEMLLVAGLESTTNVRPNLPDEDRALLEELSAISLSKYEALKQAPEFLPYLEKMSTLHYYAQANIGSRPSKRGKSTALKFEDLRAIPFVGAWSQLKQNVPGFYGVGTSLKTLQDHGKLDALQRLYKNSAFFRALCENSMQSLSKTYFPLTAYMRDDKEFGQFWQNIFNEYELSCQMLLKVSGQQKLLETNATSRKSIKLREQIVLPLITIQQYALMRIRADKNHTNPNTEILKKLVVRSLFGNINASRNSA